MNKITRFTPIGGCNYAYLGAHLELLSTVLAETFATKDEAVAEWARRRNDITGRFPCWGDGIEPYDAIVEEATWAYTDDEPTPETTAWLDDVYERWTATEALGADNLVHYFD